MSTPSSRLREPSWRRRSCPTLSYNNSADSARRSPFTPNVRHLADGNYAATTPRRGTFHTTPGIAGAPPDTPTVPRRAPVTPNKVTLPPPRSCLHVPFRGTSRRACGSNRVGATASPSFYPPLHNDNRDIEREIITFRLPLPQMHQSLHQRVLVCCSPNLSALYSAF